MVREAKRGSSSAKSGAAKKANRPSPVSSISKVGALNRFPDKEYATDILHQVVKLVAPIIHERRFKVGTVCEMFPKNANLLGLNVNKGQKILLRLRYHSNSRSFLPLGDIIGTFLHELTHNIYGPHDAKFYKYLDELKERYETLQATGNSVSGYICEEEKLGSAGAIGAGYASIREKRLKALKPKYIGEKRKLGSLSGAITKKPIGPPKSLRELILEAAERRARDAKWCAEQEKVQEVEPDDTELDIVSVDEEGEDKTSSSGGSSAAQTPTPATPSAEYVEIVDLTKELDDDSEIIVIDAMAAPPEENTKDPKSILKQENSPRMSGSRQVSFGLLPSLEEGEFKSDQGDTEKEPVYYVTSTSPRTFIQEDEMYPRRKLVADMDFSQIMKYSPSEKRKAKGGSLVLQNNKKRGSVSKSGSENEEESKSTQSKKGGSEPAVSKDKATSTKPAEKAKRGSTKVAGKPAANKAVHTEIPKENQSASEPAPKPKSAAKASNAKRKGPSKAKGEKVNKTDKPDKHAPKKVVRSVDFSELLR